MKSNLGGKYNWRMPKRCKTCQYRSPGTITHCYSCDYALITGETRTGNLIKQYGENFSRALLEPNNCPFYVKGQKISTLQQTIVEGTERTMNQLAPRYMELYKQGLTDFEIANQLHKAYETVKKYRQRQGLKPNIRRSFIGQQKHEEIAKLYDEGKNDGEISRELDISPQVVHRWRHKYNKPAHSRVGRPEKEAKNG